MEPLRVSGRWGGGLVSGPRERRIDPESDEGDGGGEGPPSQGSSSDGYQPSRSAADLSDREEAEEGERQEQELRSRYPSWESPDWVERFEALRQSLAPWAQRRDLEYRFEALNTPVPFASSCCHGRIFFSRGLLSGLTLEGVAFFAAHEMAHTECRHFASRQRRLAELRRLSSLAPGSAAFLRMEMAAVIAVRHQEEYEADHLAACWLGRGQGRQALRELHALCQRLSPESLHRATHPEFAARLQALEQGQPPGHAELLGRLMASV